MAEILSQVTLKAVRAYAKPIGPTSAGSTAKPRPPETDCVTAAVFEHSRFAEQYWPAGQGPALPGKRTADPLPQKEDISLKRVADPQVLSDFDSPSRENSEPITCLDIQHCRRQPWEALR
jgi:hypothetical protein